MTALVERPSGAVWLAVDVDTAMPAVLVEMHSTRGSAPERLAALRRLRLEFERLREVQHANVAPLLDLVEVDDTIYVVREFIEGVTLARRMADGTARVNFLDHVEVLVGALEALHDAGMLHRAIDPDHVVFDEVGQPHWTSLGMRCVIAPRQAATGMRTRGMEPVTYPAFEQKGGAGRYDVRSEIYAFAALVYHVLTGAPPLDPDRLMFGASLPPAGVSATVDSALERALSPDPDVRHESMGAFLVDLLGRRIAAEAPPAATAPSSTDVPDDFFGSGDVAPPTSSEPAATADSVSTSLPADLAAAAPADTLDVTFAPAAPPDRAGLGESSVVRLPVRRGGATPALRKAAPARFSDAPARSREAPRTPTFMLEATPMAVYLDLAAGARGTVTIRLGCANASFQGTVRLEGEGQEAFDVAPTAFSSVQSGAMGVTLRVTGHAPHRSVRGDQIEALLHLESTVGNLAIPLRLKVV